MANVVHEEVLSSVDRNPVPALVSVSVVLALAAIAISVAVMVIQGVPTARAAKDGAVISPYAF